jgi:hypothetical protein
MKLYVILFFLATSLSMAAQKNKYKHEYKFTLEGSKPESKMEFKQEPAEMSVPTLRGVVKDTASYPVINATVLITSLDSIPLRPPPHLNGDSPFLSQSIYDVFTKTDNEGRFIFTGKPGRYRVQVTAVSVTSATGEFELHIHELLRADIVLSSYTMTTTYHIHSKKKLNKQEIEAIKKCVEGSWMKKNGKAECEKQGEFYITFEI